MSDVEVAELIRRIEALETEIAAVKERNARVEADKAWETSRLRVCFLVGVTYAVTSLVFWLIAVPNAPLNALIPALAYYLSTRSLPVVRRWWFLRFRR